MLPAGDNQLQYTRLEPLGVVGCILPWNSPLMIAGFKVPAALSAGNTVIMKAADDAPLTILLLAEVCNNHLPAGVVNALTGRGSVVGQAMAEHPGIDKVSFTGSTEVGKGVARTAGERLAHISLELGGKNPSIVFPDAAGADNIDALLDGLLLSSRFARQGQSCTAGSRLFLHQDIYDEVLGTLSARLGAMKVGDPLDEASDMGAIINAQPVRLDRRLPRRGPRRARSMTTVLGRRRADRRAADRGLLPRPDRVRRSEQRLPARPGGDLRPGAGRHPVDRRRRRRAHGERLELRARRLRLDPRPGCRASPPSNRIEAGWVQVNQGGGQVVGQSYGGYKQSGIGREISLEGMLAGFTQTKQINIRLKG